MTIEGNDYNRRAARQFLIVTGLAVSAVCGLATLGYLGIQNLIHSVDKQPNPTQPNTPLSTPYVKLPTGTSAPTLEMEIILPSSLATPTSSDHCVTIVYPQPRNAFRAWIELG